MPNHPRCNNVFSVSQDQIEDVTPGEMRSRGVCAQSETRKGAEMSEKKVKNLYKSRKKDAREH